MTKRKKEDGFNVSFLDVMACGLGAVLMILILVKFNANTNIPSDEIERLKEELAATQNEQNQVQKSIDEVNEKVAMETATLEELQRRIEQLKIEQDASRRALNDKMAVVANLENSVAAAAPKTANDAITLSGGGEENYLLGLKVEGKHIGFLIDKSASMTEEKLIDVIKRKISAPAVRKASPKWQRTVRIAKWLLARLPKDAKVSMVAFSDTAATLGSRATYSAKFSQTAQTLASEIDKLTPENGTNLQLGLKQITSAMPQMTDLYIVTDGLPTLGEQAKTLKGFTQCRSFFGSAKTISGECRMALFNHTLKTTAPRGVRVNVILLPLEGESQASSAYWQWASATGGMMISPARTWP
ncbi:VWA domain-containing protein (plasmid) [Pseudoalteromonas sp. T1lg65]|uniref:VWA domain-containing protein n=1 Tax=Pseudoalteromonas sp. T1lg65 TaxID=2077101 RepID=UPI003F78D189